LVSSGFDAANGDPLGGFTITPNGYHYLTKQLMQLKKPLLVALEGGYNLDSIKNSAYNIIKALLHE
jgi:histone deacetylase 6